MAGKVIYTAEAHVTGGRVHGHGVTSDGALEVDLRPPGDEEAGTNPEQLFAVGYAACLEGALQAIARREKVELGEVAIDSKVDLMTTEDGRGTPLPTVRTALLFAAAAWTVVLWTDAWLPFELLPTWKDAARKLVHETHWIPLSTYAPQRSLADWQDIGREVGLFIPLGLLLGAWADRREPPGPWSRRRLAPARASAVLGFALELGQGLSAGRVVDITDALSHALGGVIGLHLASLLSVGERPAGR